MIQLIIYTPFISVKYTAPGPSCTRSKKQNCLTMISILLTWSWGRLLVSRSGFKINKKNSRLWIMCFPALLLSPCRWCFVGLSQSFKQVSKYNHPTCETGGVSQYKLWSTRDRVWVMGSAGLAWEVRSSVCLLLRLYCVFNCTHMTWLICRPNFLSGIADDKLREWAEKIHGLWKSLGRKVMSSKLTQL